MVSTIDAGFRFRTCLFLGLFFSKSSTMDFGEQERNKVMMTATAGEKNSHLEIFLPAAFVMWYLLPPLNGRQTHRSPLVCLRVRALSSRVRADYTYRSCHRRQETRCLCAVRGAWPLSGMIWSNLCLGMNGVFVSG